MAEEEGRLQLSLKCVEQVARMARDKDRSISNAADPPMMI